ncbi:nitrogenase cofactor biosynthesis protein NifB [Vibrio sp. EA2]|uniref:nitrogenase cofactor biosynthesis protein NifB n=1 Tax=Vibrio sp. EA2 TaxID=3079860 RepID=UPI0029495454|nr:nitrogenase cofactor biosynthesis protein NifB [Vibrio sp. EA2]MDV6249976.1 nitrogenase cofactor biosynthesis protein NifB [Vibrio sp. EA2]
MESPSPHAKSDDCTQDNLHHFFNKQTQDKIAKHPCYSKQAHQYARMHLPVAPACNIQCNYCNRKYDCSNESRPGVVSHVMDSAAALKQFSTIKKRAPNLTVVGIAGPGDALANPQATFKTLRDIHKADPTVQLCISTNGLALAEHVMTLAVLGVNHLTITINCIDPEIGEKIYPWIFYNRKRLKGRIAAQTLIERQLLGLELAAKADMLVKVNTVLIPGVNDHHIAQVSEKVKSLGATLHNIMPLISDPSHGTHFGLSGQRGPTDDELEHVRDACGVHMPQMTHCKQCRADAVGMLSDDNASPCGSSAKSSLYKVAVASHGEAHIGLHFGHAERFEIYQYDQNSQQFLFEESRNVSQYCQGQSDCGEEAEKEALFNTISDCQMVLSARIGITPWRELEKRGVTPNVDFAFQPVSSSLEAIAKKYCHDTQPTETKHELFNQQ